MRRHRGILAILALFSLVVGGAGGSWYFVFVHLPHPRQASPQQLLRWMVQRDLAAERYDVQLALVDQLEQELKNELRVDDVEARLNTEQQQQLRANFQQLKYVWFVSRTKRYFARPPEQRFSFLERQLDVINRLSKLQLASRAEASRNEVKADFFDDIESWISAATGDQKERMIEVVRSGVVCWLATGDLRAQTIETRQELAARIAAALDGDPLANFGQGFSFSSEQRTTLRENAVTLFEAWFQVHAQQYATLPVADRDLFVTTQVQRVYRWGILDFLMQPDDTSRITNNFARWMGLSKLVDQWIERASDEDRSSLRDLFRHVQRLLLSGKIQLPASQR